MGADYRGTFVIPADMCDIDGIPGAAARTIAVGSVWRWQGGASRIDGPADLLLLDSGIGRALRQRAADHAARLLGSSVRRQARDGGDVPVRSGALGFDVTDGATSCRIEVVSGADGGELLVIAGPLPPPETDLFVTAVEGDPAEERAGSGAPGMICFTPGTLVATPDGPRPVEAIRSGDCVLTRDGAAEEVLWTGARRLTGARLYAMPTLRPVRIRTGALATGRPEGDLIVSPGHRLLLGGAPARALFGTDEVLVAARDLVGRPGIGIEGALREVTYVHLMTARHQILQANGVWTESFHPASADLGELAEADRAALLALLPGVEDDPHVYGDYARRPLTTPEAALWCHAAA